MNLETIAFENNTLSIIDQSLLPDQYKRLVLKTLDDTISAIKKLNVRGAPAIGIVAAYGLYLHARILSQSRSLNKHNFLQACFALKSARPTAVNLSWAVELMVDTFLKFYATEGSDLLGELQEKASSIHLSDKQTCDLIGKYGAELLPDPVFILTHCNAGILATGGSGTALSIVYSASKTKSVHVYVDETRPVGQGARLTYWELLQKDIPATLITDNMAGSLMQQGKINSVIVGADRVAANGDVANKIGTYSIAVLARHHNIPFYVAAPLSSFDVTLSEGSKIPIEHRDRSEVLDFWNIKNQSTYEVYNPAFDITPGNLITGIITERGVAKTPYIENILNLLENHL